MNKIIMGIAIGALLLVLVFTVGFAGNHYGYHYGSEEASFFDFENMMPFMERHHPDLSDDELRQMYEWCH